MSISKLEDGRYRVDVRPRGRNGKRIRKIFDRKADAFAWERGIMARYQSAEFIERPADKRRLSEFIAQWWMLLGRSLPYAERRLSTALGICRDTLDPMLYQLDTRTFITYRSERLADGIKASTLNHDLSALSGIFRSMSGIGEFSGVNPLASLEPLRETRPEMAYLSSGEVDRLLMLARGDYYRIALFCLATGARWGEAHGLKAENIINNRAIFTHTKNGKRRAVPISQEVANIVCDRPSGRLFSVSYSRFRLLMKEAKPDLPAGQAAHALRHTFASHFMMKGGNIIVLQQLMGHASITQTMTYAHFAPDFLQDAISLNPVAPFVTPPALSVRDYAHNTE